MCSPWHMRRLRRDGFCVIDGAFDAEWCAAARAEVLAAHDSGCMHPNHTHVVQPASRGGGTVVVPKHNIAELDLAVHPGCGPALPHVAEDLMHTAAACIGA